MKLHLRADDYHFKTPLIEGLIRKRPNRFIMEVIVNGEETKAHCPNTGKIGSIVFENIPVLLSYHPEPNRKMKWTVEAISYDRPETNPKTWIGVNTAASNRYIEHFLKHGMLNDVVEVQVPTQVKREQSIKGPNGEKLARIDFRVKDTYIEVKTWTQIIEKRVPDWIATRPFKEHEFSGGDRLVKHANTLADILQEHQRKCTMISVYQYVPDRGEDIIPIDYGALYTDTKPIVEAFNRAHRAGVESWECFLEITPERVKLVDCHREDRA